MWDWYAEQAKALAPVSVLIVNGDAIDGKGGKSGGSEQLESDRTKQVEMAAECVEVWSAKTIVMTYGTAYHTGYEEDFEAVLAGAVNAKKIGSHEWVSVNGCVFDCKHKVGRSVIPHGRHTAPAREALWNALWAEVGVEPRGRVFIRSHVHYFTFAGDETQLVITTPALQGFGSKYGSRESSGKVHVGLIHFDVDSNGGYVWQPHLLDLRGLAPQTIKL